MRSAIEEILRYESPVQAIGRVVHAPMEVAGTKLPAGSSLTFMLGAAHRDAEQFPDPDRFDSRRPHIRHLAFRGLMSLPVAI
jgi:pimeloyl-[acyl-carrier protein] synthase